MNIISRKALLLSLLSLQACTTGSGGGGGSDSPPPSTEPRTITVRGTIERENADSEGRRAPYPGYSVCTFGVCGTTDAKGEFLFPATAPAGAAGIEFSVNGPEFTAIVGFPLKSDADIVDATLLRPDGADLLHLGLVAFDGVVDTSISAAGFNDGD